MPLQPRRLTPSSTPRTSGFEAHRSFIRSAAAGVMVNGAGSARRFLFVVGGAAAAGAGLVLNARSASRVLKGARAPGEPSAAAAGVARAGLDLNGAAAPPGAAFTSASRLMMGGAVERRAASAAVRVNILSCARDALEPPGLSQFCLGWPEEGALLVDGGVC